MAQFVTLTDAGGAGVVHFAVEKITRIAGDAPTTVYLGAEAFRVAETFEQIEGLIRDGAVNAERLAVKDRTAQMASRGSMMR
jgi:hypothetical protein